MRVTVISRSWPSDERSGVSLAAATHVKMLVELGYQVSIVGANSKIVDESLPVTRALWVNSHGSGSLYSLARINIDDLKSTLAGLDPELVIVEAWQTALTDAAIDASSSLGIPVLMISHGIALHPHKHCVSQWVRSACWLPYRYLRLPGLIKKLTAITALDSDSSSPRFFDQKLAKKFGVKVFALKNLAVNFSSTFVDKGNRKSQVLVLGYFSSIKNQAQAIKVFEKINPEITLIFIGQKSGSYYESCCKLVKSCGMESRVIFMQDDECNIAQEISYSMLVYAPSLTEALPTALLEAMASGTPFVASPVGAIPSLKGGISTTGIIKQRQAISTLLHDERLWIKYSQAGRDQYETDFSYERIRNQLNNVVRYSIGFEH